MGEKISEQNIENDVVDVVVGDMAETNTPSGSSIDIGSFLEAGSGDTAKNAKATKIEKKEKEKEKEKEKTPFHELSIEGKKEKYKEMKKQMEREKHPKKETEDKKSEEPKTPEVKESDPKEILRALIDDREAVIAELSKESDPKKIETLREKKKDLSDIIIGSASKTLGKDFNAEIEQDMEKDWPRFIAAKGFRNEEIYNQQIEKNQGDELIKRSNLSKDQELALLHGLEIRSTPFLRGVELSKKEVLGALAMGIDIKKVRYKGFFSSKIVADGQVFENEDKFSEYLQAGIKKFEDKVLAKKKAEKQAVFQQNREAFAEHKIQKLVEELKGKKQEKEKVKEKVVVVELPQTPEKKLETLNAIRFAWEQAEKVDNAIKTGKKIEVSKGEFLYPKIQEKELIEAKGFLSDEIIKLAENLSGIKLKKEAAEKTGYGFDKNPEKQKKYQKWLTKKVREIYRNEILKLEKETGKKIKVSKKERANKKELEKPSESLQKARRKHIEDKRAKGELLTDAEMEFWSKETSEK
jgi:hypothetical protein